MRSTRRGNDSSGIDKTGDCFRFRRGKDPGQRLSFLKGQVGGKDRACNHLGHASDSSGEDSRPESTLFRKNPGGHEIVIRAGRKDLNLPEARAAEGARRMRTR